MIGGQNVHCLFLLTCPSAGFVRIWKKVSTGKIIDIIIRDDTACQLLHWTIVNTDGFCYESTYNVLLSRSSKADSDLYNLEMLINVISLISSTVVMLCYVRHKKKSLCCWSTLSSVLNGINVFFLINNLFIKNEGFIKSKNINDLC